MLIREATPYDSFAVAKVHVDTRSSAYRGILPDEIIDSRAYEIQNEKWMDRLFNNPDTKEFMFVAENDDGEIVGFASGSLESDVDGFEGSLNTLYVLDDYQGEGIGSMLVIAVAERFKELNVNGMVIWTYTENPSRGFYEHLGGKTVCQKNIERNGSEISLTAYGWNDIDSILYK